MAKIIKRAGMIFFVSVISCLIALGCVITMQVTESSNNGIVNADTQNNIYTGQNNEDGIINQTNYIPSKSNIDYTIPSADSEYTLTCDCPNGTPCTCGGMADIWANAVRESLNTGKNVKVVLGKDWIAKDDGTSTAFSSGFAFNQGRITVVFGSEITLDLNGHTIDRNLKQIAESSGSAMILTGGTLNLYDSKYDETAVLNCYNAYKTDETQLLTKLKELPVGKITGGWTPGDGGGILVYSTTEYTSKLNMYSGLIVGNQSVEGGGLYASPNTNVNIYDGIIACNQSSYGGAIYISQANFNINKITIVGNLAAQIAGAIYITNSAQFNMDNFDIFDNKAKSGGALYIFHKSMANIYTGKIHNNVLTADATNSLAIGCTNSSTLNMYDAEIYENTGFYGTIFVSSVATFNLYGGKIHDNNTTNSGAVDCNNGFFNMYGGEAFDNHAINYGSFMFLLGDLAEVKIYAGKIYNNHTNLEDNAAICHNNSKAQLWIGAGAQIYGNTAGTDKHAADVVLNGSQKISILERLISSSENAHIGITLHNYTSTTFTELYSAFNSDINPMLFFFLSNSTEGLKLIDGEVGLDTATTKPTQKVDWYWSDTDKTTLTNVTLPYKGSNYTIKSSLASFWSVKDSKADTKFEIKNVGTYAFCVVNVGIAQTISYINPVFTVTIEPKEVDIEWETNLTYNCYPQSPSAQVKAGGLLGADICTVSVSGSAKNVGTGYVAKAIGLSNSNYKINSATNSTYFAIRPAELTIDIKTNDKTFSYNGKNITLSNWLTITHNAVGTESHKSIEALFNIDYSKIVPQFTKDGVTTDSAVNVGEYAISIKPFDVSKVFSGNSNYNVTVNYVNGGTLTVSEANVIRPTAESKYDYLILEGDKRVSYKDKGLIHGDNDSNVNVVDGKANYYMGNISPNTSVNKFISNLVYEKTQIQIYNSKGTIIYDKGNASVNEELLNNGKELAVGTGWYIEYSKDGETERITLSVLGDVNGDGRISASDVTYLRQIASDNALYESLSGEKKLASMVINKGNVTSADAEIVRNVVDKLLTMDLFF